MAKTIHLVMDKLKNVHRRKSPTHLYGLEVGSESGTDSLCATRRLTEVVNQAEIEIGILLRQFLGARRIPNLKLSIGKRHSGIDK